MTTLAVVLSLLAVIVP